MLWAAVVPLCTRLGGYGPTQLAAVIGVTKSNRSVVEGTVAHAPGRKPPKGTLYAKMSAETEIGRLVDLTEPHESVVASIGREARRAAGEIQDEPEG